jgi:hypothetical protein
MLTDYKNGSLGSAFISTNRRENVNTFICPIVVTDSTLCRGGWYDDMSYISLCLPHKSKLLTKINFLVSHRKLTALCVFLSLYFFCDVILHKSRQKYLAPILMRFSSREKKELSANWWYFYILLKNVSAAT